MDISKRFVSIGSRMYLFIIGSIIVAVLGTAGIAYYNSTIQTDRVYKEAAESAAVTVSSLIDQDFVYKLSKVVKSDEYQTLRDRAVEEQDANLLKSYFKEVGLWEQICETDELLDHLCENMQGMDSLYIVRVEKEKEYGLYTYLFNGLSDESIFFSGYTDEVEAEFLNSNPDLGEPMEAVITNGDWGWLCSSYAPIVKEGEAYCLLGADISMEEVMQERIRFLIIAILGGLIFIAVVLVIAVRFINKAVVHPLNSLTKQMPEYKPGVDVSYKDAGIVSLNIHSHDEIQDIYEGIRSMQIEIVDSIQHLSLLQRDNEQAKKDIQEKDKQITEIHRDAYSDSLTGVGSKAAYVKAASEFNEWIASGDAEFAVLMMDINNLKMVNDSYGHEPGDLYIQGCCRMLCDSFAHSPVYRIGGDEFVAILSKRDYENRKELVAKLREAFAKAFADTSAMPWERYAASLGLADYAGGDDSFEAVVKRADAEMYREKQAFKRANGSYR